MAAESVGAAKGRCAHALGNAFQQVLQGIQSIQEAFLAQEKRLEDLERTRQFDRQAASGGANESAGAPASGSEERLQSLERRMEEMERRLLPSDGQMRDPTSGVEERMDYLENQMEQLETSTESSLQSVLPLVEALPKQITVSRLVAPHRTSTSASTSTSGVASAPPPPSFASASSSAPRPFTPSAGSAAPPPLTPERRKELGEQLLEAATHGREIGVQMLLDDGADVNFADGLRFTALMYAASNSHANILSLLIGRGANVNARNMPGDTALHMGSYNDKSGRCTSLLIRAGALVDSEGGPEQTALHMAAIADNEAAAKELLAANASAAAKDSYGKRPSQYAKTDKLSRLFRR